MPVIAALDIATVLGWAVGGGAGEPIYGSYRLGRRGCSPGDTFLALDEWLSERLDEWRPAILVFEAPLMVGRGRAEIVQRLMGLAAIAELHGLRRKLRVYQCEGSTVTKAFTGRGRYKDRAEKKRITVETCRHYGWNPLDDNAADALAQLHFAQSIFNRQQAVDRTAGPLFGRAP